MCLSTWFAALVYYEIGALIGSEAVIISLFITNHFWIRLKAESNNFFYYPRYSRYSILYIYMLTSIDLTLSPSLFVSVPRQIQDLEGRYTAVFKQQLSACRVVFLLFLVCFKQKFSIRVKLSAIFSSWPKQLSYRARPRSKGLHGLPYPFLPIFCVIDVIRTNIAYG